MCSRFIFFIRLVIVDEFIIFKTEEVRLVGRAKVVQFWNNRYQGSLSRDTCDKLEQIIELDKNNGGFSDLRHIIYELSDTDTAKVISETEETGQVYSVIDQHIGTLSDMQTLGTAFMFVSENCILGDSVGLGKTPQVAGLVRMLANSYKSKGLPFRYLMLTEKSLIDQTRFKMVKFTGEYADSLQGDATSVKKFASKYPTGFGLGLGVVGSHTLLNQPLFVEWLRSAMAARNFPFDLLIVDESSVLGNLSSGITKNAKVLIPNFDRVVFLNATPFETKLDTFYSQLSLLDKDFLPTKTNFQKEYVVYDYRGMYPRPTGKYKNADTFKDLVAYRYFARTRRAKGAVMEGCTGRVVVSPLSKIQKAWLSKTQIPQLVFDCPNALDYSIEFNEDNVPKLASLLEVLQKDCEAADTILLFVHYRQAQDSLSDWLYNHGYSNRILCGETKDAERADIIRGFKNSEFRVLITNVQKGLDFGDCNYCIFYSFDPNPSKMVQFEGRITRSFNILDKHVMLLCSQGRELDRLNKVIKTRAQASAQFTQSDLSCIMSILLDE